jgi:hypothetical protein
VNAHAVPLGTPRPTADGHVPFAAGEIAAAAQKVGDNGARKMAIEFDDKFSSCAVSRVTGTENAKPIRKIGWAGHVERIISEHTTSTSGCLIQDGNIFER